MASRAECGSRRASDNVHKGWQERCFRDGEGGCLPRSNPKPSNARLPPTELPCLIVNAGQARDRRWSARAAPVERCSIPCAPAIPARSTFLSVESMKVAAIFPRHSRAVGTLHGIRDRLKVPGSWRSTWPVMPNVQQGFVISIQYGQGTVDTKYIEHRPAPSSRDMYVQHGDIVFSREGKKFLIIPAMFDLFLYVTGFRPSVPVLKTDINVTTITDKFGIRVSQATCRPRIPRRTYNCCYEASRGRRGLLVLPTPRPNLAYFYCA